MAKEGIGFDPSQKKKSKHKKKKHQATPPQQQVAFVHEGHKEKEKGKEKVGEGIITKAIVPSPNYASMNNPSYVLLRRDDGYTFSKLSALIMMIMHALFGCLRPLLLTP